MDDGSAGIFSLYLARFAAGSGFVTPATLLPKHVTVLQTSDFIVDLFNAGSPSRVAP